MQVNGRGPCMTVYRLESVCKGVHHFTLLIWYCLIISQAVGFYEYYKGQMEAWDGPALIVFRYTLQPSVIPL